MPFLLDDMKDGAEKTYVGWPNRIYVIGLDGKVVMKGRRGPKGCEVTRAEKELNAYLGKIGVRAPPAIDWRKNSPETGGGTSAKGVPDGAYIGKADGLGGPLKVEVTVKGGKIASVKITEHMESDRRPDVKKALSAVPKSIVARQNARVDTVSKATATSNAVMKAVESALKSARK